MDEGEEAVRPLTIYIYAYKLKEVLGMLQGVADPYAEISLVNPGCGDDEAKLIGKTEVIQNTLSPDWITSFDLDYTIGSNAKLDVKIFHFTDDNNDDIFMGRTTFNVESVLNSDGQARAKRLDGVDSGTVFIRLEDRKDLDLKILHLKLRGEELKNVEGRELHLGLKRGVSDPFYEVERNILGPTGMTWMVFSRSNYCKNTLNPEWEKLEININKFCDGDLNSKMRIKIYDFESKGNHTPMGYFITSIQDIFRSKETEMPFILINDSSEGEAVGKIYVTDAEIVSHDVGEE